MKVIFLDIDGVLNSQRSMIARVGQPVAIPTADWSMKQIAETQAKMLDPVAVGLLNRLTDADHHVQFVISSTHRLFAYRDGVCQLELLKDYMRLLGITGPVVGSTPSFDFEAPRGQEIQTWLHLYSPREYDRFIIIDDDSDMLPEQLPRFVQTDGEVGFSFANFRLAQALLGITDEQLFERDR